jgi:hypothetical protein
LLVEHEIILCGVHTRRYYLADKKPGRRKRRLSKP